MVLRGAAPDVIQWLSDEWSGAVEWDEDNIPKLAKHGFSVEEVEECIENGMVLGGESVGDFGEERFVSYGVLSDGRHMTIAWTRRVDALRPISCRRSRDGEKKAYAQARGKL